MDWKRLKSVGVDDSIEGLDGDEAASEKRQFMNLIQSPLFGWYLAYSTIFFSSIYTPGIFVVPYAVKIVGMSQMHASSLVRRIGGGGRDKKGGWERGLQ